MHPPIKSLGNQKKIYLPHKVLEKTQSPFPKLFLRVDLIFKFVSIKQKFSQGYNYTKNHYGSYRAKLRLREGQTVRKCRLNRS